MILALSTRASIFGVVGIVPQLVRMWTAKTAGGQSVSGYVLGVVTCACLAVVNVSAYHAYVLATGNVASLACALTAIAMIVYYGRREDARNLDITVATIRDPGPVVDRLEDPHLADLHDVVSQKRHERLERHAYRLDRATGSGDAFQNWVRAEEVLRRPR